MNYEAFARRCAATRHKIQTRFPAVALDPRHWMPQLVSAKPEPHPLRVAYRRDNRPFRRAFRGIVSGERDRKILAAVGVSNLKRKEADRG
jgi:hypothetical protein